MPRQYNFTRRLHGSATDVIHDIFSPALTLSTFWLFPSATKKNNHKPKKNIEICCVYLSASTMACVEEYVDGRQLKFPTILRSLKKRLNCHRAFYLFYPITKNNYIFFDALIYIFPGHFFPPKANVCGWLTSKSIDIVVLPSFFIFFTLLLKEIF